MYLGTNVSGNKSNVTGHKRVWAQTCLGTVMYGLNRVGTIVSGNKRVGTVVWAQSCMGTNVEEPLTDRYEVVSSAQLTIPPKPLLYRIRFTPSEEVVFGR